MKIWITTSWYPTRQSTAGIFVREQAEALQRAGHEVTVLLITYSTTGRSFKRLVKSDVPAYSYSAKIRQIHLHASVWFPMRWRKNPLKKLKQLITKKIVRKTNSIVLEFGKPDLIHHHCLSDNAYIARALAEKYDVPYVFTEHSNYSTDKELNKFNPFESFEDRQSFLKAAAECIAVSQVRADIYGKIYGQSFITISNLVADVFEQPLPVSKSKTPFRFCSVGILEQRKRRDLLLEAFARAFKGRKDIVLDIAGNGSQLHQCHELAIKLGIESQVRFTGNLDRKGLIELFDSAHAHVLPSDQETFGIVHAEAMFRGLPVISTICGGPEEFITPTNGLLCERNNMPQLAVCMEEMYSSIEKYDPIVIREEAIANFSERCIVAQLNALYKDVSSRF